MYHYTYKITVKNPTDSRRFYIGVRSCKQYPTKDIYFGSCRPFTRWQTENGTGNLDKQILAIWGSRELALEHEVRLHNCFDVAKSKEFWNQAKQKTTGFDTTGTTQSFELRLRKSIKTKGRLKSCGHKQKISKALKGKPKSESHKEALSIAKTGAPCHENTKIAASKKWKNVPKSENHKRKISKAHTGKKRSKTHCAAMSLARKGKPQPFSKTRYANVTCPHCGKIGMKANMTRYHFDNCKEQI